VWRRAEVAIKSHMHMQEEGRGCAEGINKI
jgi:hypothetical protein